MQWKVLIFLLEYRLGVNVCTGVSCHTPACTGTCSAAQLRLDFLNQGCKILLWHPIFWLKNMSSSPAIRQKDSFFLLFCSLFLFPPHHFLALSITSLPRCLSPPAWPVAPSQQLSICQGCVQMVISWEVVDWIGRNVQLKLALQSRCNLHTSASWPLAYTQHAELSGEGGQHFSSCSSHL